MIRNCPKCIAPYSKISKFGRYYRKSDSKWIARFYCSSCHGHFSQASFSTNYRQRKRRINSLLFCLLNSSISQRRFAKLFHLSRTTVQRKLAFLALQAQLRQTVWLEKNRQAFNYIQFDDLETFEHTKYKPLSITIVIDAQTRKILDCCTSRISAKGPLTKIAKRKYGFRFDNSWLKRKTLFKGLRDIISDDALFQTDQHKHYPVLLKEYFPNAKHISYKRKKNSVTGQGELKKIGHDPIFAINHTLAMMRANINRLVRKTWCTTKKIAALEQHLALYVDFHNRILT